MTGIPKTHIFRLEAKMRELKNGTKIIGIDHGYGNIKTANTIMPTGITAYRTKPTFDGNILHYNGMYYRIGESHKPFVADKSSDEDFYLLTLAAIAQELRCTYCTEAGVHIAAGLPLTWVKAQREDFRRYITKNSSVQFVFNDAAYELNIVGCSVYPQGYPAVVDRLSQLTGVNLLADIGNGTMNIMFINDKRPVESKCYTEKLGVNQCVIAAKNAVMDRFCTKIDESIIEQVIRTGKADISAKYLSSITNTIKMYCTGIFETLAKYEYDPELMRLYVVGGGGCIVKNFGEYDASRVTIIDDICAAAKGYEAIADRQLGKEEKA